VPPLRAAAPEVIYRLRDTLLDLATDCAVVAPETAGATNGQSIWESMSRELAAATQDTVELNLGVVADADLLESVGSNAAVRDRLAARLNNVDGIFTGQLGVRIHVAEVTVLDRESDPLSATTAAQALLREFADARPRISGLRGTGLAHLFTGRDLDGDTVGVAYLDTLCDARLGVSLAQNRGRSTAYESLITAHELGHNFGAPHDGEPGPCASTPQTWLMAPRINGSDLFSDCSRSQIAPRIAAATCLTPVAASQLVLEPADAVLRLLTDRAGKTVLLLSNSGTAAAQAPHVTGVATGPLEFEGITASTGACNSTADQFDCELADLAAQASTSIAISTRGRTAGAAVIELRATTSDELSGDVTARIGVTIEDGVDLRVELSGEQSVAVGQPFAARALVTHIAGSRASNVRIVVAAAAGTTIRDAGLDAGSCVVTATQVECLQPLLDPLHETALAVALEAGPAGSWPLTATVATDELERTPDDNTAATTVVVTSAASAAGSGKRGGGGAVSVICLALLGCGCLRRRSMRTQRIARCSQ